MRSPPAPPRRTWPRFVVLWIGLFAVYSANGREIGSGDNIPALLQGVTLLRGEGFRLNRFHHLWPDGLPYPIADKDGELVSRYTLGPALVALPTTLPQLVVLDALDPDWEANPRRALYWTRRMGKTAAAAIGATTGAVLLRVLTTLGLGAAALPATLIAALGSNLWMSGSQSLWQHGPAALAISATLALLLPPAASTWRLVLGGGTCALLVATRPHVAVFALLVSGWVLARYRRRAGWFAILPVATGLLLLRYNLQHFGTVLGGYGELVQMVGVGSHRVSGPWDANVADALLGTLLSPSRGLFVFTPWIPLSLVLLPAFAPALRRWPLLRTALWTLPAVLVLLALQSTWWAGWSFGPRYWTDVMPLFAVLLGFALAWARDRSRPLCAALLATGAVAIAVQALGAFCYPSSFNAAPVNIDHQHERLWSWRDGELARCLREGAHGWE